MFNSFSYGFRNLISLPEAIADFSITITNHYDGTETKSPTTFNDFGHTIYKHYFFDELFLDPFFRSFKISQETPPFNIFDRLTILK